MTLDWLTCNRLDVFQRVPLFDIGLSLLSTMNLAHTAAASVKLVTYCDLLCHLQYGVYNFCYIQTRQTVALVCQWRILLFNFFGSWKFAQLLLVNNLQLLLLLFCWKCIKHLLVTALNDWFTVDEWSICLIIWVMHKLSWLALLCFSCI